MAGALTSKRAVFLQKNPVDLFIAITARYAEIKRCSNKRLL
jgi:hypothetical protein